MTTAKDALRERGRSLLADTSLGDYLQQRAAAAGGQPPRTVVVLDETMTVERALQVRGGMPPAAGLLPS